MQESLSDSLYARFELTDDIIDKEVTEEHILDIYSELRNWRRLAAHLGFDDAGVQAIQAKAPMDEN